MSTGKGATSHKRLSISQPKGKHAKGKGKGKDGKSKRPQTPKRTKPKDQQKEAGSPVFTAPPRKDASPVDTPTKQAEPTEAEPPASPMSIANCTITSWEHITRKAPSQTACRVTQEPVLPKRKEEDDDKEIKEQHAEVMEVLHALAQEGELHPALQRLVTNSLASKKPLATSIHKHARGLAKSQRAKEKAIETLDSLHKQWEEFTTAMQEKFAAKKQQYIQAKEAWESALQAATEEEQQELETLQMLSNKKEEPLPNFTPPMLPAPKQSPAQPAAPQAAEPTRHTRRGDRTRRKTGGDQETAYREKGSEQIPSIGGGRAGQTEGGEAGVEGSDRGGSLAPCSDANPGQAVCVALAQGLISTDAKEKGGKRVSFYECPEVLLFHIGEPIQKQGTSSASTVVAPAEVPESASVDLSKAARAFHLIDLQWPNDVVRLELPEIQWHASTREAFTHLPTSLDFQPAGAIFYTDGSYTSQPVGGAWATVLIWQSESGLGWRNQWACQ